MIDSNLEEQIRLDIIERERKEEIIDTYIPSKHRIEKIEASLPKYNCPICKSNNGYDNSLHFKCNDCNFIYNSYF